MGPPLQRRNAAASMADTLLKSTPRHIRLFTARVENGQLHPVLSSMFRVTDGLRMTMHHMLFIPFGEPTRKPDTPMTSDLKAKGQKMASVEQVAQDIVKGIAAGKPVVYTPGIWQIIMLVVMHLPRVVFNKLNI